MMRITKIRLVNFHNFVDETVEVANGGHLFLLGDNGSGKTTVLDAVHYAISGGQLELNAAARIGAGNRAEGRSIQGIVLRLDFERGIRNDRGAIGYAAIELADPEGDRRMTIGVGTEATTLDARVTKWGFVSKRSLDEIELVAGDGGERYPVSREALRDQLGRSEVFFRIQDYRAQVAARLFGGTSVYDDVCRFWSMAKAYREIVSGARNFEALFRRLLPAPDPTVFGDIAKSLRSIADMETALGELEGQHQYVDGLMQLCDVVASQRETAARLRWLSTHRQLDSADGELRGCHDRIEWLSGELDRLRSSADAAWARSEQADSALRAAEAEDAEGLAGQLRAARARATELAGELAEAERDQAEQDRAAADAKRRSEEARAELDARRSATCGELDLAIGGVAELPGQLPRSRALHQAMDQGGPSMWRAPAEAAGKEAFALEQAAERRTRRAADALERARQVAEARAREVDTLSAQIEERPRVDHFAAARAALAAAGVAAQPIYELLEPRADAPADRLAQIEAMAGDDQLAALVALGEDRERAATIVCQTAPGVRVILEAAEEVALADWITDLFQPCASEQARNAASALAAAICQPEALGRMAPAEAGITTHRGARFIGERDAPRLFGRVARERAHLARLARAKEQLAHAEAELARASEVCEQSADRLERARRLGRAVAASQGADLCGAELRWASLEQSALREGELAGKIRARTSTIRDRAESAIALEHALSARAEKVQLDELQARIARLRQAAAAAHQESRRAQEACGRCESDRMREKERARELGDWTAGLRARLEQAGRDVRAEVARLQGASDEQLAHYVRVEQRGDSFVSVDNIEGRIREADRRARDAMFELEGDGSRGVRNIQFAPRFGFVYHRDGNRLTDRRDQPAAGVAAELARTIAEQRGVITAETRELMETLIVSSLARDLQAQVDTLERLIKDINRLLGGIRFGRSLYQFRAAPRAERRELVDIIKRVSILDQDSRAAFRGWIEDRLGDLCGTTDDEVPEILDYRSWFDYSLHMRTESDDGGGKSVELSRTVRALGSGGEQGVPNYLLVLALGKLMFEASSAAVQPLLFDEAFYGIDAGRRDQLLRFATELGLQVLVASPDQDGVTPSARLATTLFIVKDPAGDVHLAPYHYWHTTAPAQADLFASPEPAAPPPESAECVVRGAVAEDGTR